MPSLPGCVGVFSLRVLLLLRLASLVMLAVRADARDVISIYLSIYLFPNAGVHEHAAGTPPNNTAKAACWLHACCMKPSWQPDAVAAPQAVVALAQERVAGLHAVLQMAETGLETMPKLEDHAQVSGLRHTLQFRPSAMPAVLAP